MPHLSIRPFEHRPVLRPGTFDIAIRHRGGRRYTL